MPSQADPPSIDAYIAGFPPRVQEYLKQIRATVRQAAPGAEEMLKYRMPTFFLRENLVHFAGYPNHIGFYPTPSAIQAFARELAGYHSAKGSVQFPLDGPMPYDLIRRMVEFRVKEVGEKAKTRKRTR